MIIAVRLMGGLGNMLFQIAFAETMSKMFGCKVVYTNLKENFNSIKRNYTRSPYADEYLSVFPNIDWTKNQDRLGDIKRTVRVPFHYTEIVPEDGVEYVGYFQSYKYSLSEDFLRWLFRINTADTTGNPNSTCSIHVRRADYLNLPDFHPVLGIDYYQTAIDYLQRHSIETFNIFSDDLEWCKKNFKGDNFNFIHSRDYLSLWAMASCTHNIIANSSFSLLAAMLNPCKEKVVISPLKEHWFGPKCKDNPDDIIPPYFIQLG